MFADSDGGNRNGADDAQRHASHDLRRATSVLRLLKSSDDSTLDAPELQQEFERLHELLERIDRIAEGVGDASHASHGSAGTGVAEASPPPTTRQDTQASVGDRESPDPGVDDEPTEAEPGRESTPGQDNPSARARVDDPDERLARWWINFNGDVSLERLARLRTHLDESPFTIDTRYDEITDGLIVLRVVTEQHISLDQLDWILHQLMDLVGLDRKSAIISKQ